MAVTRRQAQKAPDKASGPPIEPAVEQPATDAAQPSTLSLAERLGPAAGTVRQDVDADSEAVLGSDDDSEMPSEHEHQDVPQQSAVSFRWTSYQDRKLASAIREFEPFVQPHSEVERAWERVIDSCTSDPQFGRALTSNAAKQRLARLLKFEERAETAAKQATGTNEEVTTHKQVMEELLQLWNDRDVMKRMNAKSGRTAAKASAERQAGEELREAALANLVPREQLSDISQLPGATLREKGAQRKRVREDHTMPSDKENSDSAEPVSKRARRSKGKASTVEAMSDILEARRKVTEERLAAARAREEERHQAQMEQGRATLESIQALARVLEQTVQSAERDRTLFMGLLAGKKM